MKSLVSILLLLLCSISVAQDTKKAYMEAEKALANHPQDSIHVLRAASSAHTLGYLAKARYHYEKADSLFPNQSHIVLPLASIYEVQGNIGKAIKYYTMLYKMDTTRNNYLRKCAQLYTTAGAPVEAFNHYRRAYQNDSLDVLSIKGLAQIFLKQRSYDEVLKLGQQAVAIDSTFLIMRTMMGQAYYGKKEYASCLGTMQYVEQRIDLLPWQNKLVGLSYFKLDSMEKAIHYLGASLQPMDPDHTTLFYLSMAYEKMENTRDAIFYMEKSIEAVSTTEYPAYLIQLARMYKNNKEWEKAIRIYRLLERLSPKYSDAIYHLATCSDLYYKDKKIAIRYYRRYLKQSETNPKYASYAKEREAYLARMNFMSGK